MIRNLTPQQKKDYVRDPSECPYCFSADISAGEFEPETSSIIVQCNSCRKEWIDCYTLTDIQERDV